MQGTPFESVRSPQIYVSNLQQYEPNMNIAVRASAGSRISEAAIKKAIWSVKETDPMQLSALAVFYLLVAASAMCVPVSRSVHALDPGSALRAE